MEGVGDKLSQSEKEFIYVTSSLLGSYGTGYTFIAITGAHKPPFIAGLIAYTAVGFFVVGAVIGLWFFIKKLIKVVSSLIKIWNNIESGKE